VEKRRDDDPDQAKLADRRSQQQRELVEQLRCERQRVQPGREPERPQEKCHPRSAVHDRGEHRDVPAPDLQMRR
jgi:hypothetical protein